eukprot:1189063-Prorocentrum_minimum.AAC.2
MPKDEDSKGVVDRMNEMEVMKRRREKFEQQSQKSSFRAPIAISERSRQMRQTASERSRTEKVRFSALWTPLSSTYTPVPSTYTPLSSADAEEARGGLLTPS